MPFDHIGPYRNRLAVRRDFPFYDGRPLDLSVRDWLVVLALTAAGFAALIGLPSVWRGGAAVDAVRIALFVILPLAGLFLVAGSHWTALFHRPGWKDVGLGVAFALINLIVTGLVGFLSIDLFHVAANPAAVAIAGLSDSARLAFFAGMVPQLLGEELLTAIAFLAVLTFAYVVMRSSRPAAIVFAWLTSAVLFAVLHLPTYQWHVPQVLLVIGTARLVLSLPYLITKNLWASTIAHVLNDGLLFGAVLLFSALRS